MVCERFVASRMTQAVSVGCQYTLSAAADWLNMDKINPVGRSLGVQSVFYWLLYQDPCQCSYDFRSKSYKPCISMFVKGLESRIHKACMDCPFSEELKTEIPDRVQVIIIISLRFKIPCVP